MTKPTIICIGFFPDRHRTLYRTLAQRFEIVMLSPAGPWPGVATLDVRPSAVADADLAAAEHTFRQHITEMEARLRCPTGADPERDALISFLLQHWRRVQDVQATLRACHRIQPVSALLVVNDHLAPHRGAVLAAQALGIPTVYISHSKRVAGAFPRLHRFSNTVVLPVTDAVCVDNDVECALLREGYGGKPATPRLYVTGDCLDRPEPEGQTVPGRRDGEASLLLFCPSWVEAAGLAEILTGNRLEHEAFVLFCRLIRALEKRFPGRRFQPVVKLHPTLACTLGVDPAPYYRQTAAQLGVPQIQVDAQPITVWLARTDLVVCSRISSVSWSAFEQAVPVITYASALHKYVLQPESWRKPTQLAAWGLQVFLDEKDDWGRVATRLLAQKWDGQFEKRCQRYTRKLRPVTAAQACTRVCEVVQEQIGTAISAKRRSSRRPLQILEVVHNFPPTGRGGTEWYTFHLSRALQERGHRVTVLYRVKDPMRPPGVLGEAAYGGLKVLAFNAGSTSNDIINLELDGPFGSVLKNRRFDVVHFQHLYGLSGNWIALAKRHGCHTALKVDDMFFFCRRLHLVQRENQPCSGPESLDKCYACIYPPEWDSDPNAVAADYAYLALRRTWLRRVFAEPDLVHAPCEFLRNALFGYGFHNPNFPIVPTGIAPFSVRERTRDRGGRLRVLFAGAIAARKGIGVFLDAIDAYRSHLAKTATTDDRLRFIVYGHPVDGDLARCLRARAQADKALEYRGPYEPDDRGKVFADADVLVMPSLGENYPFVLREALYAGVPVIASNIAGVPEIVRHGKNGWLFPAGDAHALAKLFLKANAKPASLSRLQADGRAIKTVTDEALELEEHFLRLLTEKPAKAGAEASVPKLFQQGARLVHAGQWEAGLKTLTRVLDLQPHHTDTLELVGDLYAQLGRAEEARWFWQTALKQRPDDPGLLTKLTRAQATKEAGH